MLHFNRKTEYALIAMEHMIRRAQEGSGWQDQPTNTREVSEFYHIPYPLLAKVLQKLASKGLIKSVHGTKGGYILVKHPNDISVAAVVEIFEGPLAVAECFKDEKITCPQWNACNIKSPLYQINHKIYHMLAGTSVADLATGNIAN